MLRIYVGDTEVIIAGKKDEGKIIRQFRKSNVPLQVFRMKKDEDLKPVIELAEHSLLPQVFLISGKGTKSRVKKFLSYYQVVEASGGVVRNAKGEVLMMFRRGKWDLPKGKIDEGETVKQAARREVMEETGISKLKIGKRIRFHDGNQNCTYHTYWLGGIRIIKKTYWFRMRSSDKHNLIPQQDEGITEVGWYPKKQIRGKLMNSYRSVRWVLEEYFSGQL